jgi:hypothetical protein
LDVAEPKKKNEPQAFQQRHLESSKNFASQVTKWSLELLKFLGNLGIE